MRALGLLSVRSSVASVRGHPSPLNRRCAPPSPLRGEGTEADVHTAPTYPRPFTPHYAPLTAPALDGIASERFAGTGSDGGCRALLAEVPAGRMPSPKGGRGPPVVSRPLSGGQGPSSPHGEPGCLRRNVRSLGSVDLDCGDKPPLSGGRLERSAGGQALRFRGSPRGPPERGGNV